jgi:hypothetical protein
VWRPDAGANPAQRWSKTGDVDEFPSGLSALRAIGELEETADLLFGDRERDRHDDGVDVVGPVRVGVADGGVAGHREPAPRGQSDVG